MATISAANTQTLMDSIAAHIIAVAALPGSSSALVTGQGTTLGRIAALGDASQQYALLNAMEQFVTNENAWLAQVTNYLSILDCYRPACAALDQATGGLAAFMQANTLQCDPHFFDAFNRAFYKGYQYPIAALANWQAFGPVDSNLAQITVTGSGTGTFAAGTAEPTTYGNAPLHLTNIGSAATGAASGVYTITYSTYDSSGVLHTGYTATATVPNGTAVGASVSAGASGIAVTGITLTGGNAGDVIAVSSTLLRTVAY